MAIRGFSDLEGFLEGFNSDIRGCFADTSILFAASYDFDTHHELTANVFDILSRKALPIYNNVVVKHEFLELHRRVTIPEALSDFYTDYQSQLSQNLSKALKAHQTTHRNKITQGRSAKFNVDQIRDFMNLLKDFQVGDKDGWQILGEDYVKDRLVPIWDHFVSEFNLIQLQVSEGDNSPILNTAPSWEKVYEIMGNYLIGSSDAMIVNMFLCSKISILLTADSEMARCCENEAGSEKIIFIPDSLI